VKYLFGVVKNNINNLRL